MQIPFQHTAARRRLGASKENIKSPKLFQHTAARRRLADFYGRRTAYRDVSTHSRPKAAGLSDAPPAQSHAAFQHTAARRRLARTISCAALNGLFQHTAARRRLGICLRLGKEWTPVSTHSRLKAAGCRFRRSHKNLTVSTHSRLKAAGCADGVPTEPKGFQHTAA